MAGGPAIGGGGKRGSAAQTVGVLNLLTDLAFNLLIFFVVCASTEPEKGRPQDVPNVNEKKTEESKVQPVKLRVSRTDVFLKGETEENLPIEGLAARLRELLAEKTNPRERIVMVQTDGDTTYSQWIKVAEKIEEAGGVMTMLKVTEKVVTLRKSGGE